MGMTSLESMIWLQNQPGVQVYIGHEQRVTIFLEGHIRVDGTGIHDAVQKTIKVYTQMLEARERKNESCLRD